MESIPNPLPVSSTEIELVSTEGKSSYRDYFEVSAHAVEGELDMPKGKRKGPRGGVVLPFPVKLYNMLEGIQEEGLEHIVSWQPHGRCFMVHETAKFVADILPRYVCVRQS
jgi:hypothetical protein